LRRRCPSASSVADRSPGIPAPPGPRCPSVSRAPPPPPDTSPDCDFHLAPPPPPPPRRRRGGRDLRSWSASRSPMLWSRLAVTSTRCYCDGAWRGTHDVLTHRPQRYLGARSQPSGAQHDHVRLLATCELVQSPRGRARRSGAEPDRKSSAHPLARAGEHRVRVIGELTRGLRPT
jgi:hypothetical protein